MYDITLPAAPCVVFCESRKERDAFLDVLADANYEWGRGTHQSTDSLRRALDEAYPTSTYQGFKVYPGSRAVFPTFDYDENENIRLADTDSIGFYLFRDLTQDRPDTDGISAADIMSLFKGGSTDADK